MDINIAELMTFLFQIESHCDTDCPKAPIACNFSAFGCKESVSDRVQISDTLSTVRYTPAVTVYLLADAAPQPGSAHAGVHADAHALHGRVPARPQPQRHHAQVPVGAGALRLPRGSRGHSSIGGRLQRAKRGPEQHEQQQLCAESTR